MGERFSLEGVGYAGLGPSFNAWMYRVRRVIVQQRARRLLAGASPRVLDIGSGTGFYLDLWRSLGPAELTGSDITQTAVDGLQQRFADLELVRFDVADEETPLAGRDFDLISAFDVLFHIVDDERYERAFVNIHDLLRPGGLLLFSDNFLHGETVRSPTQASRSLEDVTRAVTAAGLEVVERRPMMVLMNGPVDSRSRVLRTLWRSLVRVASRSDRLGWLVGAVLFPLELTLASLLRESPTTELMVCRRPA